MPYFDGTGPFGTGPIGRGFGPCGRGLRRSLGAFGFGYGFRRRAWTQKDESAALDEEEKILEEELKAVREEKKALKGQK